MKKLVLLALICLGSTSCKDDNDAVNSSEKEALLVGKWNMITAEFYQNGTLQKSESLKSENCDYDFYQFKEDKTKDEVYHNPNENCATTNDLGNWSYHAKSNQITLTDQSDGYIFIAEVISINENSAKFKVISDGGETPTNPEIYYLLEK